MNPWSGHATVMKPEVVRCLQPERGGVFVDATLGGAGHAEALLTAAREAGQPLVLVGIDRDPDALEQARARLAPFGEEALRLVAGDYRDAAQILSDLGLGGAATGLVVDAGVSSHQLDTAARGFSFMREGPLDMRMGPSVEVTAGELIAASTIRELAVIFGKYGELKRPMRMARAVKGASDRGDLGTTLDLARVCAENSKPGWKRIHPATTVFQALRIAVNDELGSLEALVGDLGGVLAVGGRAAFISFHSLEDRIVKKGLRRLMNPCTCPPGLPMCACGLKPVVKVAGKEKLIRPSAEEIDANPRSRSARLRCVERIAAA